MYRRILVPIDGSPASAQGIEEAIRLARPMRSRVRLLHAIDDLSVSRAGFAHDGDLGTLVASALRTLSPGGAPAQSSERR